MSGPLVILGAGPAGAGAAFQAAQRKRGPVMVLEAQATPGGNAGSFDLEGIRMDYGSHRLHPSCDPRVLADLQSLLGADLLQRPRYGRILLRGRWIHFPLRALDLALRLPKSFLAGSAADVVRKRFARADGPETFASVLKKGLGETICRDFYFPYARKLWGLDPRELSPIQARRRVSASTPGAMLRKIVGRSGWSWFYYPRRGYGQLTERLCDAATEAGVEFRYQSRVTAIEHSGATAHRIQYQDAAGTQTLDCGLVLSTLPINLLARSMWPEAPRPVLEAASSMSYRGMILIYLLLEQEQFSGYDAHYFPEEKIPISRMSEPKNYTGTREPRGLTALCAELPCDTQSKWWAMSDAQLADLLRDALAAAGIPIQAPVRKVVTRRLAHAYPIYKRGFEEQLAVVDAWLAEFTNVVTFGRQGLFAHDNTHHGLYMAYCAIDCLKEDLEFDAERWRAHRREFESHVVED